MKQKTRIRIKTTLSVLLLIDFLVVSFTGIELILFWQWKNFLWVDEYITSNLHRISGLVMIFIVFIHFSMNFKLFKSEIKQSLKK